MHIFLLNGPPGSGKDFAAAILGERQFKMAGALKRMTHAAMGLRYGGGDPYSAAYFEAHKDVPRSEFGGATPRDAYIQMSEGFVKPLLGEDYLGRVLAKEIGDAVKLRYDLRPEAAPPRYAVSDCGFREEALALVDAFGPQALTLVRLAREGCSFDNDSRGYITLADVGVRTFDIFNDADFRESLNGLL